MIDSKHLAIVNIFVLIKRFTKARFDCIESVGQRAAKLLAVKVGGLKKKSATLAITAKMCVSASARV